MSTLFDGKPQSTPDVLRAKDERVRRQASLCETYKQTLVVLKLNIPGPIKDSPKLRAVLEAAVSAFKSAMPQQAVYEAYHWQAAGSEYYAVLQESPHAVKAATVAIEALHPLGRLMDFDVFHDHVSLSRADLGLPERRCLLCGESAFVCGRSRSHSLEALLETIEALVAMSEVSEHHVTSPVEGV